MSLLEWKKKHLDSISTSFCAAKWLNASIHLGHGYTHSCHLPLPHPIDKEAIKINPSALHNTEHKKKQRQKMLQGERPKECEYCWKIEDIGRNNISDRVYKSMPYKAEDIKALGDLNGDEDIMLKTLEISFDRTCNLACSYCNSSYSTTWAKDIKKNGAYQQFKSDGAGAYTQDGSWTEPYGKLNEGNPYVEAFLKWWPELSTELQEIRITGGEPTMSDNFWKFCDLVKETKAPNLRMAVNSNLQDILKTNQLIEFTKTVDLKEFDLYTSCEAYGEQAEYIRDGLNYKQWRQNLVNFLEGADYRAVTIMMTITSLSLFSITTFLDDMLLLKAKYGHHRPMVDLNILRWPSFMSPVVFPDHIKKFCHNNLMDWYLKNKDHKLITQGEIEQVKRLLDYIEVVNIPHRQADTDKEKLHHDFKSFYQQYDKRRGKSLSVFPKILTDWVNTIELDHSIPHFKVTNGRISHYEE